MEEQREREGGRRGKERNKEIGVGGALRVERKDRRGMKERII